MKILLFLATTSILWSSSIQAQSWAPAPTYGNAGATNTDIGTGGDLITRHALQPDGKLLLAGRPFSTGDHISLMRLDPLCGALDPAFGNGGKIAHQFQFSSWMYDMTLLSSGKILCVGREVTGVNIWDHLNSIYRFLPDGSVDTTFNHTGYRTDRFDALSGGAHNTVVEHPGGGYFTVGRSSFNNNGGVNGFGVMRYTENGDLDTSYSADGRSWFPPPSPYFYMNSETALLLPDTSIIYVGGVGDDINPYFIHLAKFRPDGDLDTTFGEQGQLITPLAYGEANPLRRITAVLLPDGRFLLGVRSANQQAMVVRFMPDGTIDTSYGSDGISEMDPTAYNDIANGLQLLADGGTAQFGSSSNGIGGQFILRRDANGMPVTTFGNNGVLIVPDITGDQYIGGGLMLDAENAIVYGSDAYPTEVALTIKMTTDPEAGQFADLGANIDACTGTTVQLDAGFPGSTFLWSTGDTDQVITISAQDEYSVSITTNGGCVDSDTIAVTFNAPPVPLVSGGTGALTTDATGDVQWFLNGEAISGATTSTYIPVENGDYTVSATDANGCSTTSAAYALMNVGSINHGTMAPSLYQVVQDPTGSAITILGPTNETCPGMLLAADGRVVAQFSVSNHTRIAAGHLGAGNYTLAVRTVRGLERVRFVKF